MSVLATLATQMPNMLGAATTRANGSCSRIPMPCAMLKRMRGGHSGDGGLVAAALDATDAAETRSALQTFVAVAHPFFYIIFPLLLMCPAAAFARHAHSAMSTAFVNQSPAKLRLVSRCAALLTSFIVSTAGYTLCLDLARRCVFGIATPGDDSADQESGDIILTA